MADDLRSAKEIYDKAVETRTQYVDRAEEIASLTIPYLMPESGYSSSSDVEDSLKQSDMATNINSLTSKITMTLFPTSSSSFRLDPSQDKMAILKQEGAEEVKQQIYMELSDTTSRINAELERQDVRPHIFSIIQDLITVGPIIVEKVEKDGIKYHSLSSIGVMLDDRFEAYEMATMQTLTRLPEGITVENEADSYELYTSIVKSMEDPKKWIVKQSIGEEVVGDEETYTDETLPFQYIGWSIGKGDTYHRPYTEKHMGNIRSFNALAQVLTDGAVISSKSLIFVDPRKGRTKMKEVAESSNGDIIEGRADDVTAFQLGKNYDFQIAAKRLEELKMSLEKAYLVNSSAVRASERTTLGEVEYNAQDLETQLAGIYSIMANKLSKRIISWIMLDLGIKLTNADMSIITGLDSLSMKSEAQQLDAFMGTITNLGYNASIKEAEVIQRYANYYGINTLGLIKTTAELSQEQQAAQQAQMAQEGMGALAQSAGQAAGQQVVQQPQEGEV